MKTALKKVAVFSVIFSLMTFHINAQSFSWFFSPTKDHSQPQCFNDDNLISSHNVICLGNKDDNKIYLTFDVGYENGNVAKTLDTLREENVKGAFFILPHLIDANPELVRRMIDEGHLVCNHSTTHRDMSKINDLDTFRNEIEGIEKKFSQAFGREMDKYFRPPEGKFSEKTLEYADSLGYTTVFWSLAYADWDDNKQLPPEKALDILSARIHSGCVMLLHPTGSTNAKILKTFISDMKEKGYTFDTLDNLSRSCTSIPDSVVAANRNAEKKIAITFDDGPHSKYTPMILDILNKYGAKATFFRHRQECR